MAGKQKIWQPETAAYKRFQFPVHEENELSGNPPRDPQPDQAEVSRQNSEINEKAREVYFSQGVQEGEKEGYNKGVEEGRRLGFEEGKKLGLEQKEQQQSYQQEKLFEKLQQQISSLQAQGSFNMQEVAQWLGQVIEETCRQVIRRELVTDSDQIIRVIQETLTLLPESEQYSIHLNPMDAELLKKHKPDFGVAWQLVEDSNIAQGDCSIDAAGAEAQARVESRLVECLDIIRENLPVSLQEVG